MKTITLLCFSLTLLCNSVYSQTFPCNVTREYKDDFKVQKSEKRLLYKNDSGFYFNGSMIRLSKDDYSLTAVHLSYLISIKDMDEKALLSLKNLNTFEVGQKITFTFQNKDGSKEKVTLDISDKFDVETSDTYVQHTCGINIPKEEVTTFTTKKVIEISAPYYGEYFNMKVSFPTIFMDFYKCFLNN